MKKILPFVTAISLFLLSESPVLAAASLSLSPSTLTKAVGSSFDVTVKVNTGGQAVNTVKAYLEFDASKLKVSKINTDQSFANVWAEKEHDNVLGRIRLVGGCQTPGFNGSAGNFAVVSFEALAAGSAKVDFMEESKVRLNSDSSDILSLTSSTNGTYTIGGGSGSNDVGDDDDGGGTHHFECISNTCTFVSGSGSNLGGCTLEGASCSAAPQSGVLTPTLTVLLFGSSLLFLGISFRALDFSSISHRFILKKFEKGVS